MHARISKLVKRLMESDLDALVTSHLPNVRYLTGFSGSAGIVYISRDFVTFLTDGRYDSQSRRQLKSAGNSDISIFVGNSSEQMNELSRLSAGCERLAIESRNAVWAFALELQELVRPSVQLIPSTDLIEQIRRIKDAEEIEALTSAAHIADEALTATLGLLSSQPTERSFAQLLEAEMARLGSERPSFDTIVGAGPNSALPHAQPTERTIAKGDVVVIDFGATYRGYHSDMTRTFVVGQPTLRQSEIHESVIHAQRKAIESIVAGRRAEEVDAAARNYLADLNLANKFIHSVGHGVGLEIHETPILGSGNRLTLMTGEVVTAEPGLYLEGEFGVRIEDMIHVGSEPGCITQFGYDWIV